MFLRRLIISESIFPFNYHLTTDEAAFRAASSRVLKGSTAVKALRFVPGAGPGTPLRDCVPQTPWEFMRGEQQPAL
jgi:hypothetical protein